MKKYKVIALSVGGLGNKIHRSNDEVSESDFIPGRAEELVKQGFLAPVEEEEDGQKPYEKMNKEELIHVLVERGSKEEELKGYSKKELLELIG